MKNQDGKPDPNAQTTGQNINNQGQQGDPNPYFNHPEAGNHIGC